MPHQVTLWSRDKPMIKHYILKDKKPVAVDLLEWAQWFEIDNSRRVDETIINNDVSVSTVFIGIGGTGISNMLFETMIFGGKEDQYQVRSSTWDEAEKEHAKAVAIAKETL